ncbi:uncharacterized protein EI90DRAFT_762138 [Cantharellus anzutake]|uniref:uncharacterized protein n=1 Tax=Cantharellus anzutake TaxID=1750568 RepID=UPI0019043C98|nr:uncharacterized protein EI90DRAFT_762138 [Cantharellus anzutake]KAF8342573.1 hypothetical protein EI90DRAFT_762138 [Cantharellus anzutake]
MCNRHAVNFPPSMPSLAPHEIITNDQTAKQPQTADPETTQKVVEHSQVALRALISTAAIYIDAINQEESLTALPPRSDNDAPRPPRADPSTASYRTHISSSMKLLQYLQNHISNIHEHYQNKRLIIDSQLCPVAMLPLELLCDIFSLLDDWRDILAVSHVSRDWRAAAVGCSSLWSPGGGSIEWLNICLQRSGDSRPLDVCLRGSGKHLATWPDLTAGLLPYLPRWRSLEWRCTGGSLSDLPTLVRLLRWVSARPEPRIEKLVINDVAERRVVLPTSPIPVLRSVQNVSLNGIYLHRLGHITPHAQIITLSNLELRTLDWQYLFMALKFIRKLTITDVMTPQLVSKGLQDGPSILVPTLEELYVDGAGSGLIQFLQCDVDFPNLRRLSISQNEDPLLRVQLGSRFNQLEYLHIEGTPPSLKTTLLWLLRAQDDDRPALPRLRHLDIELDNAILDRQIEFEKLLIHFVTYRDIKYKLGQVESKLQSVAVTELTESTANRLKLHVDGPIEVKVFIPIREL